jgi:hypothetical protein
VTASTTIATRKMSVAKESAPILIRQRVLIPATPKRNSEVARMTSASV